jgi:hypothetical protein
MGDSCSDGLVIGKNVCYILELSFFLLLEVLGERFLKHIPKNTINFRRQFLDEEF